MTDSTQPRNVPRPHKRRLLRPQLPHPGHPGDRQQPAARRGL